MELIENLAVGFATAVEANGNIYVLILCVLSLIIGVTFTVERKIGRGSYFFYTMLIGLFLTIKDIVWVTSALALANNFLSLLVLSDFLVLFIAAYMLVIIAKSRSNDIYGHSRYAILAFIPIGNLWLIFGNSKDKKETDKFILNGVLAALIGILLLVTTIIASISINNFVVDENRLKFVNNDDRKKVRNRLFSYHLQFGTITDALNYLKSLETDTIGTKIDNMLNTLLGPTEFWVATGIEHVQSKSNRSYKYRKPIESCITYKYIGANIRKCNDTECRTCATGTEPCRAGSSDATSRSSIRKKARIRARASSSKDKRERGSSARVWSRAYVENFGTIK